MITDRHPSPERFRARLNEYLTGGACETFAGHYQRLWEDARVVAAEDDELREAKEEIEELREALKQRGLDLAEAYVEIETLKDDAKAKTAGLKEAAH